jgi:hypothetical protein
MDAERPEPQEVGQDEEVSTEDVHTSVKEMLEVFEATERVWTDRQAVDHFGFIPEDVTVKRSGVRFPAWK